jgi:hypothetical protein
MDEIRIRLHASGTNLPSIQDKTRAGKAEFVIRRRIKNIITKTLAAVRCNSWFWTVLVKIICAASQCQIYYRQWQNITVYDTVSLGNFCGNDCINPCLYGGI